MLICNPPPSSPSLLLCAFSAVHGQVFFSSRTWKRNYFVPYYKGIIVEKWCTKFFCFPHARNFLMLLNMYTCIGLFKMSQLTWTERMLWLFSIKYSPRDGIRIPRVKYLRSELQLCLTTFLTFFLSWPFILLSNPPSSPPLQQVQNPFHCFAVTFGLSTLPFP
jgi:hypothetical protein